MSTEAESEDDDGIVRSWDHTEDGGWQQVPFDGDEPEQE